jgi:hypothetical protein
MAKSARKDDVNAKVEAALKDMQSKKGHGDTQAEACRRLFELVRTGTELPEPLVAKTLKTICAAMEHFHGHVELHIASFAFMAAINTADQNSPTAVREGFVAAVLNGMRRHRTTPIIQISGCFLVNMFACSQASECLYELWRLQALVAILEALDTCLPAFASQKAAIVGRGCDDCAGTMMHSVYATIVKMLDNNKHIESGNGSKKPVLTGLKVILRSMATHMQSHELLKLAVWAIHTSAEANPQNADILGTDGIKSVADVMRMHESDASLQAYGCRALGFLALENPQRKQFVHQHGYIEFAVRMMNMHAKNLRLQQQACLFCSLMIDNGADDDCRVTLGRTGFVRAAAQALYAHKQDPTLSYMACEALKRFVLVRIHASKYLMITESACDMILAAMKVPEHKHNIDMLVSSCEALYDTLTGCARPLTQEILQLRERVTPVILETLSANISSTLLAVNCAKVLGACSSADAYEALERDFFERDGTGLLVRCMNMHMHDTDAINHFCTALIRTSSPGRNQDCCRETGAIEAMLLAAEKNKHNSHLLANIRTMLHMVAEGHAVNTEYVASVMTSKHAKILCRSGQQPWAEARNMFSDSESQLRNTGLPSYIVNMFNLMSLRTEEVLKTDIVTTKIEQRETQKLAETCSTCGQSATVLGLTRLLRCSGCTLERMYCSTACQRNHWGTHKGECRANRVKKT